MADTLQQRIAGELRAELARRQIPARRLAEALGLSAAQTSERLLGRIAFRPNELEIAAALLEIPMAKFLAAVAS